MRNKRSEKNGRSSSSHQPSPLEIVYAFSHVETWIEDYAKSNQLSAYELTVGVAELLQRQTHGALLGLEHRVPAQSRPQASAGSDAVAEVEVARGARSKVQRVKRYISPKGMKALRAAQKKRWAKHKKIRKTGPSLYWGKMSKIERQVEMQQRMTKRAENKVNRAA